MTKIEEIAERFDPKDAGMILDAYREAEKALKGKIRGNGRPFIDHPVGVCDIVSNELGLPADCITAVLLHEANRFQGDTAAQVNSSPMLSSFKSAYPSGIIDMVTGLNNIAFITLQQTNLDGERYRKLIISYSTDPRVVLIKLADRLEVMRNMDLLPQSRHRTKIMETMLLYVPLAHQLGLYNIKSEMEDLFLKYSEPDTWRTITNSLKAGENDRKKLLNDFIRPLEAKLRDNGIDYTLKMRTKSAYSIWKKMQVQNIPFSKVYDINAIRFIINAPPEKDKEHELCWKVYSLVTEEYTPDTSRLRDWLTVPKANGYESLHTTVEFSRGVNIEVQIRTARMDFEAERGRATHWAYKGIKSEEALNTWLSHMRDVMQHNVSDGYTQVSPAVLNEVFVFTPKGELRQLSAGATVLDFAFEIHTNVGIRCTGGKINGRIASIRETLKTGDVVEILTSKNQKPAQDWLSIATTSKARSKIRQKLGEEQAKRAQTGRELLERRLKNWKLELKDDAFHTLTKKYGYRSTNDFYADLGEGKVDIMQIKEFILDNDHPKAGAEDAVRQMKSTSGKNSADYLTIDGRLDNMDYRLAKCCNPIFGDEVFGFVSTRGGIGIHRMSCPNAARLIENYPYRVQKVRWKESSTRSSFQVTLKIVADGEISVSNQILTTVGMFKASVRSFNVTDRSGTNHEITMTIHVPGNSELDKITASLKKLKEVRQVTRL